MLAASFRPKKPANIHPLHAHRIDQKNWRNGVKYAFQGNITDTPKRASLRTTLGDLQWPSVGGDGYNDKSSVVLIAVGTAVLRNLFA